MRDNFIYINLEPISNMIFSFGISPADFLNGIPTVPDRVVLLRGDHRESNAMDPHTRFETVEGQPQVRAFLIGRQNVMPKWIDYSGSDDLTFLMPDEIAELLYIAHMDSHIRTPFYAKLQNEYVYLSLHDGFLKVYFRHLSYFNHVLDVSIKRHLRTIHNSRWRFGRPLAVADVPDPIILQLTRVFSDGIIIAFDRMLERNHEYQIPVLMVPNPERETSWHTQEDVYSGAKLIANLNYNQITRAWKLDVIAEDVFTDVNRLL
ncbi:hypothetical protein [Levilactobacillus bambusae]|uniref:Uncharacterized protein n=1 Tax=Levilactobacillus bambusae TaxID=2024736 RepID=A0A2V1MW06_9LACO|nr:hypothetical protein [Levilactobacillus bambusae]PWF99310.1 hypothetical protein DCM90_09385 [Levilactobacillus bambusae]